MSNFTLERRFNILELKLLIKTLGTVIKEYENCSGRSLLIDNIPKVNSILKHFIEYHKRLEEYTEKCKNVIKSDGFKDWHVHDNELFLQTTIGVILPLEDYYILYFYLREVKLTNNGYVNNIITSLRDELAKEIAFKSSCRYLCDYGIEKAVKYNIEGS